VINNIIMSCIFRLFDFIRFRPYLCADEDKPDSLYEVFDANSGIIYLPVSIGESIDKLTILDIKLQKISDSRKLDVQKEYDLLYNKLELYIVKYSDLYHSMKQVNMLIWDMMDSLRDGTPPEEEYLRICKECIEYNDIRFRIKNKLNYASNSELREQKSYNVNRIVIDIANKVTDVTEFIRPIKYFSFLYDEIVIVSDNTELIKEFSYDPTIVFCRSLEEQGIRTNSSCPCGLDEVCSNEFEKDKFDHKNMFVFNCETYNKMQIYDVFGLDDDIISRIM